MKQAVRRKRKLISSSPLICGNSYMVLSILMSQLQCLIWLHLQCLGWPRIGKGSFPRVIARFMAKITHMLRISLTILHSKMNLTKEAIQYQKKTLQMRKRLFFHDHAVIADSYNNLALAYQY